MLRVRIALIAIAAMAFMSCSSNPLVLPAVGPATSNLSRRAGHGSLQVYTAVTERNDSGIRYFYPRNYHIYQTNRLAKSVVNSMQMSEQPAVVDLPAGEYVVKAHGAGGHSGRRFNGGASGPPLEADRMAGGNQSRGDAGWFAHRMEGTIKSRESPLCLR
jgi:hypothetical protein